MVYAKRMFKRYRKNLRNNRTLSTRRIFNNKSAKSQAKQIYALRRSINSVKQMCKPEVKVVETPIVINEFTATTSGVEPAVVNNMWRRYNIDVPSFGVADNNRVGNLIKLLPVKWFINAQYGRKTHTSNGIPYYNLVNEGTGACFRLIAIQSKQALKTAPTPSDIFPLFENYPNWQTTISNMNCPYRNGITANWNILYDKVKYINDNKPIYNKRLKITPADKSLVWEEDYLYPKGIIFYFIICSGLRSTGNDLNNSDYDYIAFNHHTTVAYTDA